MSDKPISSNYAQMLAEEEAKHEAEKKALVEEFTKDPSKAGWTPEEIRTKLENLLPQAFQALQDLLIHAESESVRANLAKYIFDVHLKKLSSSGEDPDTALTALLAELKKND